MHQVFWTVLFLLCNVLPTWSSIVRIANVTIVDGPNGQECVHENLHVPAKEPLIAPLGQCHQHVCNVDAKIIENQGCGSVDALVPPGCKLENKEGRYPECCNKAITCPGVSSTKPI